METKFNSQICTDRLQSERLLALGLKKETADMSIGHTGLLYPYPHREEEDRVFIPAWSLHRLMVLAEMKGTAFSDLDSAYETTISIIAAKIRFGYFNKEYLCEK